MVRFHFGAPSSLSGIVIGFSRSPNGTNTSKRQSLYRPGRLARRTGVMLSAKLLVLPISFGMLITPNVQNFMSGVFGSSQSASADVVIGTMDIPASGANPVEEVIAGKRGDQAARTTLYPELVPVCSCESTGRPDREPRHYEADGVTVLRGKINPLDVGACQINLKYHEQAATAMGLDLFKEEDNYAYANHLYDQQGFKPWSWSAQCHGQY